MKAFIDFLGLQSNKFDSYFCTISVVDYKGAVSEAWHCHESFHLSAILKGGNLESRQRADIPVLPGMILAYHPGEIHRNRFTQFPSKNLNLEIKDVFFKEYNLTPLNWNINDSSNYFSLLKIYKELETKDSYTQSEVLVLLMSMFLKKEALNAKATWLNKLKEIIDDRWSEFISLEDLSTELQMHPVTISKYFRKYYQCTLSDYMRMVKVEKALQMLLQSKKSVTQIAFECGFADQSHMTRLLKQYTSFKPKQISNF